MKILHVITGLKKAAGTSTFCGEVCNQLAALGHAVSILVKSLDGDCYPLDPKVKVIGDGEQWRATSFDVVHIHALWDPWLIKVAHKARRAGIPVVWSTHGMTAPWAMKHKWWKKCLPWHLYQKRALARARLIHCTSDFEVEWNRKLGFNRTFLAPLGTFLPAEKGEKRGGGGEGNNRMAGGEVFLTQRRRGAEANLGEVTVIAMRRKKESPPPKFRPLTEVVEAVAKHQAAGFSPSTTVDSVANPSEAGKGVDDKSSVHLQPSAQQQRTLLYVGRIYPVKALDRLIEAFAVAAKQKVGGESRWTKDSSGSDWVLRLVGPDQAGHMAELMSLCDRLGLSYSAPEKVGKSHTTSCEVVFAGPKFGQDLDAEYENCDALALVSHTENFGATVVDAMAHGKPVITSTKTPWKVVADKRCGWWVDNDAESLSTALSEVLNSSTSELLLMGRNGRHLVEERYTWPAVASNLSSKYEEVLNGRT